MAAFDYAEMAQLAVTLLREYGEAGQLTRPASNPTLGSDGRATGTPQAPETVLMLEITGKTRAGLAAAGAMSEDSRSFEATHIFEPVAVMPPIGSTFTFGGRSLVIKDIKPVRPTSVTLLYYVDAGRP